MMPRQFLPALRSLLQPRTPAVETKSFGSASNPYVSMTYAGVTNVWGTEGRAAGWDMDRVIEEGYQRSIWTFKSVEAISKHPGALAVEIGRGGDERRFAETMTDHPLLRVLNHRANPLEKASVFKKRLSAQVLLSKKGAFVEKTRSRAGTITRLDLLPPSRVEPIPDPHGDYLSHFQFTTNDGRIRELEPERVVWVRDPHPTDPFSGISPLEAAGLSVDLDNKARVYNISFLDNDGRPGGVIGIDVDGVDSREIERIQRRLGVGAHHAGELTIVGTGPGGLNYVDTSARPRDMSYETLSSTSKGEILAAFGVPESIIGNASERTYANADREEWMFWDHTELPHLKMLASAFDEDLADDGWTVRFNTSSITALEFPRRQARTEAREEFNAGLITIDEYRERAQLNPFNVPHSRALWISPQKAPVPANPQDAAALGIGPDTSTGMPALSPGEAGLPGAPAGDASAAAAVAEARADAPTDAAAAVAAARALTPDTPDTPEAPGTAAAAVAQARSETQSAGPGAAASDVDQARQTYSGTTPGEAASDVAAARRGMERKALEEEGYEVTDDDFDAVSSAVAAALTALLARQQGVIVARLHAPKLRKHTRYWEPDGPDDHRWTDQPVDGGRVVSAARWSEEATQTLLPILQQAAATTAAAVSRALTGASTVPPAAVGAAALAASQAGEAVTAALAELAEVLRDAQDTATSLEDLVEAVFDFYRVATPELVARLAESCAVATINGAAEAAAESAGPEVVRTWITRGDTRVRPAHRALQGTTLPAGTPYTVDGFTLRYPGDPFAPIALTVNCRCRLHYQTD
ncbi:phage portal protein [Streptomyces sp. NPDC091201]|uniref:phage portal protein n=1 Tax=Streptomyces sp. NPDC091201 TaxID=3155190 RepID=UPI00341CB738